MIAEEQLAELAGELIAVRGVLGVVLGGSRARREHTPTSDVDLGLYYRPPLDVAGLTVLARKVAGPTASLTRPGEWGPWVDGGGWLRIAGTPVDWIYRDLDRVHASWAAAQAGRYTFHAQVGHPLGFPDFCYAGEIALGVILAAETDELANLHRVTGEYPPKLAAALVKGLWEAAFLVQIGRKALDRADTAYVAGCLFRAMGLCAHALHGHAGRWLINEKGAIAATGRLSNAPDGFTDRAQDVLAHLGRDPRALDRAITAAADLVAETAVACR